jgi:perosamine synthetase
MGRDALALCVTALRLTTSDKVLLPAFLCREVLRPFVGRADVEPYDVERDLTVDPEVIRKKLDKTNAKVLLTINYFGFLQPFRNELRSLCRDRGVVLIEDCAHSLLTVGSGEAGDLCIYSFRKFLPVPDGGGLKINASGIRVDPAFHPRAYSNGLAIGALLRSVANFRTNLLSRAWLTSGKSTEWDSAPASVAAPARTLPMSSFASNGVANTSLTDVVHRQRSSYQFWLDVLAGSTKCRAIFPILPDGVCPLGMPILTPNRDELKKQLENHGVLATVEWRLPAALGRDCIHSHEISAQILTLPTLPGAEQERERLRKVMHD